ncbi:MAG TPA: amino acid adenylation domain-containing protein, partial [Longimicrobium sp.]|nr:amino acid adenylation domain-containing protein [Longimicrobium sp.]
SATEALEAGARAQHVTAATLLQGAWALLLARATGVDDVVFGSVESGRPPGLEGAETMVGPFINTLATRVRTGGDATVRTWLQALQAEQAEARRFAYVPLPSVQRWAGLAGGTPLFESLIAFENYPIARGGADGGAELALRSVGAVERTGYPISLTASPARGGRAGWRVRLTYATDRFAADAMERGVAGLERLLEQLATRPDLRLAEVDLLSPEERRAVLVDWNRTAADFPRGRCVHERFAEQAALAPEALAVDGVSGALSYSQLEARANRLAHLLRARGVGVETRVGVLLERGPELVVALLAILKAGGAYVPLDPEYPAERLAFMLRDSGAALLVAGTLAGRLPDPPCPVLRVEEDALAAQPDTVPESGARPENLAYVVYTSGSTGTPKGVMVPHAALANLCDWHARAFDVGTDSRATLLASVGFDASAWELWPYLLRGASVRAVPAALRLAPAELGRWMQAERVTHTFLPTPLAEALLAESTAGPSAWLLTGGDRMRRAPGAGLGFRVANNYGPTESTVVATSLELETNEEGDPPIGRPIVNTRGYVLDAALRPVPIGAWGELYLGGTQLARGYLARPALTAGLFIPDPFSDGPGARLYRTGDRVRWTADGVLEYGGRMDEQIKVRGHRIEPGEIEAALLAHPDVTEAAVVAREEAPGQTRLVAYVAAQAGVDALREHLRERLPAYMVPSAFVTLERLPLTPNGKVDRRALPAPEYAGSAVHTAPRDETEQRIARVWAEVLGVEEVGVEDNFFDLGGDSLLLMRVYTRLGDTLKPGL